MHIYWWPIQQTPSKSRQAWVQTTSDYLQCDYHPTSIRTMTKYARRAMLKQSFIKQGRRSYMFAHLIFIDAIEEFLKVRQRRSWKTWENCSANYLVYVVWAIPNFCRGRDPRMCETNRYWPVKAQYTPSYTNVRWRSGGKIACQVKRSSPPPN